MGVLIDFSLTWVTVMFLIWFGRESGSGMYNGPGQCSLDSSERTLSGKSVPISHTGRENNMRLEQ